MTTKNNLFCAQEAVATFLNQQAGSITCEILTGGSEEDAIIKCTQQDTNYVVKFFSDSEFGKNEISWTQHASDLGIGPKLYYANVNSSYMIIEFVSGNSLVPSNANIPAIIKNVAASVAKLHNSYAPFAYESDMFTRIDVKYKKLNCSGKIKDILINCMRNVKKIETELESLHIETVPCHNDLNWGNIFVNNNQVTLIDWGDAALDNPYYDIAAFIVLNVITTENEKLFFDHYDPDIKFLNPHWQAYRQLYKHLVYFEFALNLLSGLQAAKSDLLHIDQVPEVQNVNNYLSLLAERQAEIDSIFLYNTALASLYQIKTRIPST